MLHSTGRWVASAPQPDGAGAEHRFMQCQFQHMSEVVALETDERSGTYRLGTWQEILLVMEANEIVDMEAKGHVLKRIMPQAGDESTGHW
jgi:hypothetical protein